MCYIESIEKSAPAKSSKSIAQALSKRCCDVRKSTTKARPSPLMKLKMQSNRDEYTFENEQHASTREHWRFPDQILNPSLSESLWSITANLGGENNVSLPKTRTNTSSGETNAYGSSNHVRKLARSIRAGESHLHGNLIHNFLLGSFRFRLLGSLSFNSYFAFVGCHACVW